MSRLINVGRNQHLVLLRSLRVIKNKQSYSFSFRMVWESRHDQGRSNACLIHPELVIVRCYVQDACANHAFPLSQSIHHVNRIENRTKLARCCKCPCLDIPFLAKFVGSRCILGGLLFVLPLLETLKVWGWLSTRL